MDCAVGLSQQSAVLSATGVSPAQSDQLLPDLGGANGYPELLPFLPDLGNGNSAPGLFPSKVPS
jgi:hypothetical protein